IYCIAYHIVYFHSSSSLRTAIYLIPADFRINSVKSYTPISAELSATASLNDLTHHGQEVTRASAPVASASSMRSWAVHDPKEENASFTPPPIPQHQEYSRIRSISVRVI